MAIGSAGRRISTLLFFACSFASAAAAQPTPLPAISTETETGFLTRSAWFLSFAGMKSGDPRFSWVARGRLDADLFSYDKGRINLLIDDELVLGRERREFDFNHQNIILENSFSYRVASIDVAAVFHHTSRHLIDRPADRIVAWHTLGGRAVRVFAIRQSSVAVSVEYERVVQRTYVDYAWTSQFAIRVARPLHGGAHLFASGGAALVGVDRGVVGRGRQDGARVEGGVHVPARRAGIDLFGAWERRIDGYPMAREPTSWLEVGFKLGTR